MSTELLAQLLSDGQILETQGRLVITESRVTGLPYDFILLLEGHISEETMNQYLSTVYDFPTPPDPNPIPDQMATELLDVATIRKLGAMPYRFFPEDDKLQILIAPPPEGTVEEVTENLSTLLGFDVEVFIVSTLRFQYDFWICYGTADLPNVHAYAAGRLTGVGDPPPRPASPVLAQDQGAEEHDLAVPALRLLPVEGEKALPSIAVYQAYELLTEMLVEKVERPTEVHKAHPVQVDEPMSVDELMEELDRVTNKDEFAAVFERFAASTFKTFAMFMCLDGLIVGWRAFGQDLTAYDVYGVMLPDDRASFLATIHKEDFFLGKPEPTVANRRLMSLLQAEKDDVILGATIKAGDRKILITAGVPKDPKTASEYAPVLYEACGKAGDTLLRLVKNRSQKDG